MSDHQILAGGAILLLAVVAAVATQRLRFPLLVTFLGLGMLLGSEGLGRIQFDDPHTARSVGVVGLIAILFEGGLTMRWDEMRRVLAPAFVLSTVGVVVTAGITALAAAAFLHLNTSKALLIGGIVGSTDAAAVFAMLRFTHVNRRIGTLLSAESGLNDPMAVTLTLGLISFVQKPDYGITDIAVLLVRQLGLGLLIGLVLGLLATRLLPLLPSQLAPFAPVASIGIAAVSYGTAASLHASGFLAVYVVGICIGNSPNRLRKGIVGFHEGLAFLAQVVLFIVLGLLVFPSGLGDVAWAAIGVTAVLTFVARPITVALLATPFGFSLREQIFLSTAGLRGAVPIVLATFAVSAGIAGSHTLFNAVFFVVLVSTIVQGVAIEPVVRRLKLNAES